MKRGIVILLLLLASAACGAYRFPGAPPPGSGTVTGQVTVYPCGPVEPAPDQGIAPCKLKPPVGLEIDFNSSAGKVTSTQTDAGGRYAISLPEGTYKVSFPGLMRITSGPPVVTVKEDQTLTADYVVDSGIRTAGSG